MKITGPNILGRKTNKCTGLTQEQVGVFEDQKTHVLRVSRERLIDCGVKRNENFNVIRSHWRLMT